MLKLKVEEMSCGHCAATVQKAVKGVDPAAQVEVDLGSGMVSVDTTADEARVSAAIDRAGYPNRRVAA